MNNNIKIKVCLPAWSESDKSWYLLTEQSAPGCWNVGKWFPKSKCKLKELEPGVGELTLPLWLYNEKF